MTSIPVVTPTTCDPTLTPTQCDWKIIAMGQLNILYLVFKSLMIFHKVTDYIKDAPTATDTGSDLADLISQQANTNTNTQLPVTNQNSNHTDISNALNNALQQNNVQDNSQYKNAHGFNNNNINSNGNAPPQFGNTGSNNFSLF